ncbi:DUF2202 domain-containing protein [Malaciobacter molluscorum LMG 25693]|uniref:DUF2202 domain-containing protein n=1 Tax=Malaciobacter molluscorum LMG 25693 TaxID=870501 RepID=A0A2G1DF38_9BACT|nr:DUF2202 domain-containing protein [Malaciobacter molluscorum]AXX93087.1 ferritin-like protein (DUF2202 domain) [Malaciobacter molluscorum LMG 25693]PHO16946.1 DUF2202 domain-containing protein [Malaciobacter molluscorum LMG 25693]RXJ95557.1 DUF2202 domain-containing protein [Malaciobacter molluscorum]
MANFDENILLSQRVDLSNEQAIESQVLRIAVYDEFKAYESYSKIIEKFGAIHPFVNIKEAEAVHYSALMPLLQKYNVEVPINDWADKIEVPNTYIECCELGVASEINNIAMYDDLIANTKQPDIKDILFKLQAASYNNHLPAFRKCVLNHYNGVNQATNLNSVEEMMNKASEYQMLLEDIASGNMDQNKISELFNKLNISMISGAGFGAALVAFLNSYTQTNKE